MYAWEGEGLIHRVLDLPTLAEELKQAAPKMVRAIYDELAAKLKGLCRTNVRLVISRPVTWKSLSNQLTI